MCNVKGVMEKRAAWWLCVRKECKQGKRGKRGKGENENSKVRRKGLCLFHSI
jgi:hypothetical protein